MKERHNMDFMFSFSSDFSVHTTEKRFEFLKAFYSQQEDF